MRCLYALLGLLTLVESSHLPATNVNARVTAEPTITPPPIVPRAVKGKTLSCQSTWVTAYNAYLPSCKCDNGNLYPFRTFTGYPDRPCDGIVVDPTAPLTATGTADRDYYDKCTSWVEMPGADHRKECATTLSVPTPTPTWTVRAWNNTSAYAGTLSGGQLSSLITDALYAGCSSTAPTWGCAVPTFGIPGIEYYPGDEEPLVDGSLEFIFRESYFEDVNDFNKTIQGIAHLLQKSTENNSSCHNMPWESRPPPKSDQVIEHHMPICFIPGGGSAEYFDGIKRDGPKAQLVFDTEFVGKDNTNADHQVCAAFEEGVSIAVELLEILLPEFAIEENEASKVIDAVCEIEASAKAIHGAITSAVGQIMTIHGHITSALGVFNKDVVQTLSALPSPTTKGKPQDTTAAIAGVLNALESDSHRSQTSSLLSGVSGKSSSIKSSSVKSSSTTKPPASSTTKSQSVSKSSASKSLSTSQALSKDQEATAIENVLNLLASPKHSSTAGASSSSSSRS